jgi:hypothetical protein
MVAVVHGMEAVLDWLGFGLLVGAGLLGAVYSLLRWPTGQQGTWVYRSWLGWTAYLLTIMGGNFLMDTLLDPLENHRVSSWQPIASWVPLSVGILGFVVGSVRERRRSGEPNKHPTIRGDRPPTPGPV